MKLKSSGQSPPPAPARRELPHGSPDGPVERYLYDPYGRVIMSLQPSGIFTKTRYNSIGQTKWTAMGYGTATGYAAALDIDSDDT
ncbi:MAG: hypothetical protein JJU36_10700, partial [Phycisphaeraceae bacterium]|nr:hypothetical protein [Phycisphaeraceae bacterium]